MSVTILLWQSVISKEKGREDSNIWENLNNLLNYVNGKKMKKFLLFLQGILFMPPICCDVYDDKVTSHLSWDLQVMSAHLGPPGAHQYLQRPDPVCRRPVIAQISGAQHTSSPASQWSDFILCKIMRAITAGTWILWWQKVTMINHNTFSTTFVLCILNV